MINTVVARYGEQQHMIRPARQVGDVQVIRWGIDQGQGCDLLIGKRFFITIIVTADENKFTCVDSGI